MNAVMVFTLLLAVFTRLNALGVTVERQPLAGSPYERDVYGVPRMGAAACWPDGPVVYVSPSLSIEGEAHEYVHALDCADDGVGNGSPCASKRPGTFEEALRVMAEVRPDLSGSSRGWVWYAWAGTLGPVPVAGADAEWCAIVAGLTGSLG